MKISAILLHLLRRRNWPIKSGILQAIKGTGYDKCSKPIRLIWSKTWFEPFCNNRSCFCKLMYRRIKTSFEVLDILVWVSIHNAAQHKHPRRQTCWLRKDEKTFDQHIDMPLNKPEQTPVTTPKTMVRMLSGSFYDFGEK